MIKLLLTLSLIVTIALLGSLVRWFDAEKERLDHNRLGMLKELRAAPLLAEQERYVKKEMETLAMLPSKEKATERLVDFFDLTRSRAEVRLLKKIYEDDNVISLDVRLTAKSPDRQRLNEILSLRIEGGMVEITSVLYESGSLELTMHWSIPFKEGA